MSRQTVSLPKLRFDILQGRGANCQAKDCYVLFAQLQFTDPLFITFGFIGRGNLSRRVQKALPLLKDGGSIILNGSVASVKGTAAFGVYVASKAAIRSFVRTWTTDLKDRRIRSNVVSPGPINTPLVSRQSADVIRRIVSTIPMGRMGEREGCHGSVDEAALRKL